MAQPVYGYTTFGTLGTSTGSVTISTGPTIVHSINILSSGTGSMTFYNATASSTGTVFAVINPGVPKQHVFNAILMNGMTRGNTTSTAEVTVTWA